MKVRHKDGKGDALEVLEESSNWYIVKVSAIWDAAGFCPKSEYEPVPEERWVDVTAECETDGKGIDHMPDTDIGGLYLNGYRLRKVRSDDVISTKAKPLTCAFVVEKRTTQGT